MIGIIIFVLFIGILVLFPGFILLILTLSYLGAYAVCEMILRIFGRSFKDLNQ